tara:strand:- start:84 stop:485 length:402 start_codon:yes stop_codon:yes gene_type:complete
LHLKCIFGQVSDEYVELIVRGVRVQHSVRHPKLESKVLVRGARDKRIEHVDGVDVGDDMACVGVLNVSTINSFESAYLDSPTCMSMRSMRWYESIMFAVFASVCTLWMILFINVLNTTKVDDCFSVEFESDSA